jgi:hypothetical protein
MNEQKERARAARAAMGDLAWAGIDLGLDNIAPAFTGYEKTADEGRILAMVAGSEICSRSLRVMRPSGFWTKRLLRRDGRAGPRFWYDYW